MDKKRKIQLERRHRILSLSFAAAILLITAASSKIRDVYADGEATTGQSTEKSTDDGTDVTTNLLKDEHGRIVFWEWNKVTTKNYKDLFTRRETDHANLGNFHPSMLVMHDSNMNPVGFVSTYADKDHVFYGPDEIDWASNFEKLGGGDQTKIDAIYQTLNQNSAKRKTTDTFDKKLNRYVLLDSDSKLLNDHKELFSQDKFFTSGTPMGVLYFSPVNRGATCNFVGYSLWEEDFYVPYATMQVALARGSAKGNSGDMSYNSIGQNPATPDEFLVHPADVNDTRFVMRDNPEELMARFLSFVPGSSLGPDDNTWIPKSNVSSTQIGYDSKTDYSHDIGFFGMYAYKGEKDTDKWLMMSDEGWSYVCVKDGYLLDLNMSYLNHGMVMDNKLTVAKNILSATDPSIYNVYTWYIGTPHVFASVKGTGGDPETGAGGTTTVGKGETLILKDTSYKDASGNDAKSEGVVLPEGSKIIIEDGGVLSIEGNFINNGQIINRGGTIIIKDGGCVSPFGITDEGTIECSAAESGQSGDIIVMPGGRLYALVDNSHIDLNSAYDRKYFKGGTRPKPAAMTLTGGSSLINYGTLVTNYAKMDSSAKLENRKDALAFIGFNRTDTGALLYNSKVTKSKIDNIGPINGSLVLDKAGIRPIFVTTTVGDHSSISGEKGTVLTENTATLVFGIPEDSATVGAVYKRPEY